MNNNDEVLAITYLDMFRFFTKHDVPLVICGIICSILLGVTMPILSLLLGNMADAFSNPNEMVSVAYNVMINYIIFGVAAIFGGWGMFSCWMIAGERQANRCRH